MEKETKEFCQNIFEVRCTMYCVSKKVCTFTNNYIKYISQSF